MPNAIQTRQAFALLTVFLAPIALAGCSERSEDSGPDADGALWATEGHEASIQVNGQGVVRYEVNSDPNVIAGFQGNSVMSPAQGATIAGGGHVGEVNQVDGDYGAIGGGKGNKAGEQAFVGGGNNNIAAGEKSTVAGGAANKAQGLRSAVLGGISNVANLDYTVVGGGNANLADAEYAQVGGGLQNQANGRHSVVLGGEKNRAQSDYATILGGKQALTWHSGEVAYANGMFSTQGDAQHMDLIARVETIDTTSALMFLDGASAPIRVPENGAWMVEVNAVARQVGGTGFAFYAMSCGIHRDTGVATLASCTGDLASESDQSWGLSVDAAGPDLTLRAQGGAGQTVRWVASLSITQVIA